MFAVHAVFATSLTISQIFIYDRGTQRLSKIAMGISFCIVVSISIVAILCIFAVKQWIFFFYYLSGVKVGISFIKYCPQVYLNFRRKSTVGWNIWNVLLDFTGGLLSLGQLVFDSWRTRDWNGITGDPAKFALGFLSMAFDVIFMVQHYCLYHSGRRRSSKDEASLLLQNT